MPLVIGPLSRKGQVIDVPAILKVLFELAVAFVGKTDGWKTYLAAIGLVGLAVYQLSQGQVEAAVQSLLGALAAFGIRRSVAKAEEKLAPPAS